MKAGYYIDEEEEMFSLDLSQLRGLILDMDGVIWKKYHPLGDLKAIFERIAEQGRKVILATNNSTQTPAHYLGLLAEFDVELDPWQVIGSSQATAHYLSAKHPAGGPVYIVGEVGLHQALAEANFQHSTDEEDVLAVVVGLSLGIDYVTIARAAQLIRGGAAFIGTNPDKTFPTPQGLYPGAGVMLAAVESASGAKPTVIGKPQSGMYQVALERLGTSPTETLVVGDRLETDIAGAQRMGCHTALVLSGVASLTDAQIWSPRPDIIAQDLTEVIDLLAQA